MKLNSRKSSKGNALLFTMSLIGLLIVLFVATLTVYGMCLSQRLLVNKVQLTALLASRLLNSQDSGGQLDNITAASRQLLFNSRSSYNQVVAHHPEMLPLAQILIDESCAGSELVQAERSNLMQSITTSVSDLLDKSNKDELSEQTRLLVPWLAPGKICLDVCELGNLQDSRANVAAPLGNNELLALDNSFVDKSSELYSSNITLTLPSPDASFNYKLSSFPAPVKGTIAPIRVAENETFVPAVAIVKDGQPAIVQTCEYFPSAIRIKAHQTFATTPLFNGLHLQQSIFTAATVETSGASPMP